MSGVVRNGVRELMGHTHTDRDWEAYENIDQSLRLAGPELRLGGFRNWWDLLRSPISIPGTVRYHSTSENGYPRQQDCMAIYLGLRSPLLRPSPEEIVSMQNGEFLTTRGTSTLFLHSKAVLIRMPNFQVPVRSRLLLQDRLICTEKLSL